mgnify:CR=1 FL=1
MRNRSGIWGYKHWLALVSLAWVFAALLILPGCGQETVTGPVVVASPVPTCVVTVTVNGDGSVNVNGCGNVTVTNPSPSPSPGAAGDNVVASFAVFCYGFSTPEGQPEPNHNLCALPVGYPNIAVTASPKNAKGIDISAPGDITSAAIIDWTIAAIPANGATLTVNGANRFNATVTPASPRVAASFVLTATYKDPAGGVHIATKNGAIQ